MRCKCARQWKVKVGKAIGKGGNKLDGDSKQIMQESGTGLGRKRESRFKNVVEKIN